MDEHTDTGNGASAAPILASAAANAGEPTADASTSSEPKGKRNTGKRATADASLSDREILAILENSLKRIRERWEPARVFVAGKEPLTVLVLPVSIRWCSACKHFRLESEMRGDVCQYHDSNP